MKKVINVAVRKCEQDNEFKGETILEFTCKKESDQDAERVS